jgi:hypothetical protein
VVKQDKKGKLLIHNIGETPISAKTENMTDRKRMPKFKAKLEGF